MDRAKEKLITIWNHLSGKKTNIIGIVLILIGLDQKNEELIGIGLVALGLRHGVKTEISRLKE